MLNFDLETKPIINFGEDSLKSLNVDKYENILILYGSDRIEKNGLLDEIEKKCKNKIFRFNGITANPKLSDVEDAINLCCLKKIDLIIAVGGGSVIDAAKAISIGAKHKEKIWNVMIDKLEIFDKIDLVTIPTMIATGSETNDIFVILNDKLNIKRSLKSKYAYPICAILNPKYTLTINKRQTIAGIVDTMSHLLEQYFNNKNFEIINNVLITYLKRMIEIGPKLIDNLSDLNLREEHMYIAYSGYNGDYRTQVGGDWACHGLDYGLAGEFNNIHGEGLSIIMPKWIDYIASNFNEIKILTQLGYELFGIDDKDDIISSKKLAYKLQIFFESIGAPSILSDININTTDKVDIMVEKSQFVKPLGATYNLTENDIKEIYIKCNTKLKEIK